MIKNDIEQLKRGAEEIIPLDEFDNKKHRGSWNWGESAACIWWNIKTECQLENLSSSLRLNFSDKAWSVLGQLANRASWNFTREIVATFSYSIPLKEASFGVKRVFSIGNTLFTLRQKLIGYNP